MTGLAPTPRQLELMRAIADGRVEFDSETSTYVLFVGKKAAGTVTDRFNRLRSAGLAKQVHFTMTEPTDAGREWLAKHDTTTRG